MSITQMRLFILAALVGAVLGRWAGADQRHWGGSVNGDWFVPANWLESAVPGDGDDVEVASGSILLTNNTALLSSFTITNATVTFTNWNTALRATNVVILNKGKIQAAVCFTNYDLANTNRVLILCSNLTVAVGGQINVSSNGFRGGRKDYVPYHGTGPGGGQSKTYGGGGSYGGSGGMGGSAGGSPVPGPTYGPADYPSEPGSGGGGGNAYGGNGGGAVWIEATGDVTIDGLLSADGGDGNGDQGAAGSGGAIVIQCRTIRGTGTVGASGGNRGGNSGGGGGGRLAIHVNETAQAAVSPRPTIRFLAAGGLGYDNGSPGTLFFSSAELMNTVLAHVGYLIVPGFTSWAPDTLTVSNAWLAFPEGFLLSVTNDLTVVTNATLMITNTTALTVGGNLVLSNGGSLYLGSALTNGTTEYGCLLSVTGAVWIGTNSSLRPMSHPTNGGSLKIAVPRVLVMGGGRIDASGLGFSQGVSNHAQGFGPGGGYRGANSGGGGGYGGVGGKGGHITSYGGTNYGLAELPLMPGSGGGDYRGTSVNAGYGGGLIWIQASGIVTLDGTISANGSSPSGYQGGGAGGGIYISCRKFTGSSSGILRANGGKKGGSESGGGGGGRIAVECVSLQWPYTNNATATGGADGGSGSQAGTDGTVVWLRRAPGGTVFVVR